MPLSFLIASWWWIVLLPFFGAQWGNTGGPLAFWHLRNSWLWSWQLFWKCYFVWGSMESNDPRRGPRQRGKKVEKGIHYQRLHYWQNWKISNTSYGNIVPILRNIHCLSHRLKSDRLRLTESNNMTNHHPILSNHRLETIRWIKNSINNLGSAVDCQIWTADCIFPFVNRHIYSQLEMYRSPLNFWHCQIFLFIWQFSFIHFS